MRERIRFGDIDIGGIYEEEDGIVYKKVTSYSAMQLGPSVEHEPDDLVLA